MPARARSGTSDGTDRRAFAIGVLLDRGVDGLWRIWTTIGATQQYYPLTHTAFWLQWHLWGDAATTAGDFAGAITYYRNALRDGSLPPQSRLKFARALFPVGDLDGAATPLEASIKGSPGDPDAPASLGEVLLTKSALPEAVAQFQESLRLRADAAPFTTISASRSPS